MTSTAGETVLSREECDLLLRLGNVGRVVFVVDDEPYILPVNYCDADGVIVFRTALGTMLNEVAINRVVFEVDGIDEASRSGWSVIVRGFGRDISDAVDDRSRKLRELPIEPWAGGERHRWFEILPEQVTGRRVGPH
jgi:nitroimidazol reductase NimA-like FMN-containing flavoprotein (pyridoxamine 5'-phosphate oxidase superfamily)